VVFYCIDLNTLLAIHCSFFKPRVLFQAIEDPLKVMIKVGKGEGGLLSFSMAIIDISNKKVDSCHPPDKFWFI